MVVGPLAWEDDPIPSLPSRGRPIGIPLLSHQGVSWTSRCLCSPFVHPGALLRGSEAEAEEGTSAGDEEGKAAAPVPEVGKESRRRKKPLLRQTPPESSAKECRSGILFLVLVCK